MKNITPRAEEVLIERSRQTAHARHKNLKSAFREWLQQHPARESDVEQYDRLLKRLRGRGGAGCKFSRDEMNCR
jgi:hypothetical protein